MTVVFVLNHDLAASLAMRAIRHFSSNSRTASDAAKFENTE
tara:strand:+ start:394 stop:516 length:123 start_codon:yes stop_codon:yes gene_type:complete